MPMESLIVRSDKVSEDFARQAGKWLGAEIIRTDQCIAGNETFILEIENLEMALLLNDSPGLKSFTLNFDRVRKGAGGEPLLRAVGGHVKTLVDMTPGWCADALQIARQGIRVSAIERNRVVFLMIRYARTGMSDAALRERLQLFHGRSERWLETQRHQPDVIYLDPVFPVKTKSAATRKEMVILQRLSQQDDDDHSENDRMLFDTAMKYALKRVVVKRPHHAAPLAPGKVGETRGKLVRFDIYKPGS